MRMNTFNSRKIILSFSFSFLFTINVKMIFDFSLSVFFCFGLKFPRKWLKTVAIFLNLIHLCVSVC